jgi:transcriptional regulator with XRE-family HTH domain
VGSALDGMAAPTRKTRAPGDSVELRQARGQRIQWAREAHEVSRIELARRLGVDMTTLRNIEQGESNPGILLQWRLFHALGISLDYVVAGRLTGVDPEVAGVLVRNHPELAIRRLEPHKTDKPDTDPPPNTSEAQRAFYLAR